MREKQSKRFLLLVQRNTNLVGVFKETGFIFMSGDFKSALKETLFIARPLSRDCPERR